jgi:hypothetical protein
MPVWTTAGQTLDAFREVEAGTAVTFFADHKNAGDDLDRVQLELGSPSFPVEAFELFGDSQGDDGFIDVEIYAP